MLGICDHANNLADGRVEVLACGAIAAIDQLQTWLAHGPPLARVDALRRIDVHDSAAELHTAGFSIGDA